MDKQLITESQIVKKASEQQVVNGSNKNFIGSVAIQPLTSVTEGIKELMLLALMSVLMPMPVHFGIPILKANTWL